MQISFDEFKKVELKVGKIISAEKVSGSEKLFRLEVDFGLKPSVEADGSPENESNTSGTPKDIRQIISGIAPFFESPEAIIGKHVIFVTNLEPRAIMGLESNGMILAAKSEENFSLLEVPESIKQGTVLS